MLADTPAHHRTGYVALVGKPNVGKSTLLNAFMGRKLSIVTRKPQTTRHRILGILSDDDRQIIFLDTPGIIAPRYGLQRAMMQSVGTALSDADVVVFMTEAQLGRVDEKSLEMLPPPSPERPVILAINKMDLIDHREALPLVDAYTEAYDFASIVPISAQKGYNLEVLLEQVTERLPLGPPFYPKDMVSEHPERFFVSEIIREKIFQQFRQEVPYSVQVNIVAFDERHEDDPGEKDHIEAEIVVGRSSQKGILIGKGGQALKRIGTAAREDVEQFLGRPVYLGLHVKVRDDWRDNPGFLRSYGYGSGG
jgi:GTP-binding protein Era